MEACARRVVLPHRARPRHRHRRRRRRKPKIKDARELIAPIFKVNDRGALGMNTNLALVAQALDMAEKLA